MVARTFRLFLALGLGLCAAVAAAASKPELADAKTGPFRFDRGHTTITFAISHFGFSNAYGTFKTFEPKIVFDPAKPEKTSIDVTIDAASIDTAWPARDEDLRTAHFFDVAKYPTITFKSAKVELTGIDTAKLSGDLTLRGVTKTLVLDVKLMKRGPHPFRSGIEVVGFSATGILRRSEFGMTALIPGLADDVQLTIAAELNNSLPPAK